MNGAQGKVEAIYIADKHGEPPHEVGVAVAQAGRGIEGDRNFDDADPDSRNITLIEAEAFDDLKARHGFEITPLESRRQGLVRGGNLGGLLRRRVQGGGVESQGAERS